MGAGHVGVIRGAVVFDGCVNGRCQVRRGCTYSGLSSQRSGGRWGCSERGGTAALGMIQMSVGFAKASLRGCCAVL